MRRPSLLLLATCSAIALAALLPPAGASAHGNFTSNLAKQRFEVAPDLAEFVADVPVDITTARAQLRYLGDADVDTDLYFADNVPTIELSRVDGTPGTTFAFDLPELGAGTYALDWEVTPIGDHLNRAMQLFVVTVGSPTPDPTPPVPQTPAIEEAADTSARGAGPIVAVALIVVLVGVAVGAGGGAVLSRRARR